MAPSSGKKSNKYQILDKKGLCATPKPQFFFSETLYSWFSLATSYFEDGRKNPKKSGQQKHPNVECFVVNPKILVKCVKIKKQLLSYKICQDLIKINF